ncbi:MAG: bifunctional DNA primase/polymerase [Gaiellaceae bacterium]
MGPENTNAAAGDMLAAALAYAAAGLPVLPLDGKIPRNRGGLTNASVDVQIVAGWWDRWPAANIGIRTGAPSGLVVVDIDVQHGGGATLKALEQAHGALPKTAQTLTGGGGQHLLFRHPGVDVPNSAGQLGAGVDVRRDGGYIVAPPSTHASGRPYQWTRTLERGLADLPAWLLEDAGRRRNGTSAKVDTIIPEGKRRAAMLSVAGKLKRAGLTGDEILPTLRELNRRCQPPLEERELESVAHKSTIAADPETAIPVTTVHAPLPLDDVVATFRKHLHLPDPGALYIAFATVAANRMPGDPVWLLLVAASSSGKTEILFSLAGLEEVEPAATLSEAALLSGVPRKDVAAAATGGLLKKIGDYGILILKDFGSVLSMHRDSRSAVLAALREIFDGSWDRPVGADGGRTLHWDGKLGLIAGVTTVVDRHHAVMDSLGSRFTLYRVDVDERQKQARRSLSHLRSSREMRTELRDAVSGFFAGIEIPKSTEHNLSESDIQRLVTLADFVTVARSPVERDNYTRDIELVPDAEAPGRFVGMLAALLEGLRLIGLEDALAWPLTVKVAFDSMPAQRRKVIEHLYQVESTTTTTAATMLGLPTSTARRTLEDLAAHGVVERESGGQGTADTWRLDARKRLAYAAAGVPEMSDTPISKYPNHAEDDKTGKVP